MNRDIQPKAGEYFRTFSNIGIVRGIVFSVLLFCASASYAAVLVVDSFATTPFTINGHLSPNTALDFSYLGPIGTLRGARFEVAPRGVIASASAVTESSGALLMAIDQTQVPGAADGYYLDLYYQGGGPYSILGQSAFEFEFSSVSGIGELIVEIGTSFVDQPGILRTELTEAGIVSVPFDNVNMGPWDTLDNFGSVLFRFGSTSSQFEFSLDQIRVVPEPSVLAFLAISSIGFLYRRRTTLASRRSK
jgi:hypothetical protein